MKKIFKYIPFGLLLLLGGCSDMFDKEVPTYTVVDNAIYDATSAENALRGVYSYLVASGSQTRYDFDTRYIKDAALRVKFFDMQRNSEKELAEMKTSLTADYVTSRWKGISELINAANLVIDGVERLDKGLLSETKRREIIGEARFMRAFGQLYLMKYYSWFWDVNSEYGPIMRRVPTNVKNTQIARSTVRKGYELILEDLDDAIAHAPDFTTPFRASKGLAKAYKVEVLLMRGEGDDCSEAARLAEEVKTDYGFALEDSFADVFANGYNSKELMFSRWLAKTTIDKADGEGGSMKRSFGGGEWPSTTYKEILTTENNIFRYVETLDSIFYEAADKRKKVISWKKLWKEDGDCPMYYMRLAQMYIYKAEALARTNAPVQSVLDELNALRSRSKDGDHKLKIEDYSHYSQDQILQLVYNEAVREVGMENGCEYFMAVRIPFRKGYPLLYLYNDNFAWNRVCWPIPQDELKYNILMEQNPLTEEES